MKRRATLAEARQSLGPRQRARGCWRRPEVLLAEHPEWGRAGVRFDVMLVDGAGRVRRIADAFRVGD